MKTVAAFLNSEGGVLFIGVNDDGEILGLMPTDSTTKTAADCISRTCLISISAWNLVRT
ncbi:MAG TPA: ATP-binding protein [Calditrichaeota bacterium]|nr:ATP-binding protein [Calditrichota bacterium]